MNSKLKSIAVTLAVLLMSGCASMSGDECVTSDWTAVGYEDGARGYTGDRIGNYRKACAKHGISPDLVSYQRGRDQGLTEYCQPARGFNVGANGGRYYGVCRADLEADFLDAYKAGHHLYTLRSNVNRANSAIHSKENELNRIEESIIAAELELISPETTTEERVVLLLDIKDMSERTGQLEAEIRDLYEDRAHYRSELEHYQVRVADLGY